MVESRPVGDEYDERGNGLTTEERMVLEALSDATVLSVMSFVTKMPRSEIEEATVGLWEFVAERGDGEKP